MIHLRLSGKVSIFGRNLVPFKISGAGPGIISSQLLRYLRNLVDIFPPIGRIYLQTRKGISPFQRSRRVKITACVFRLFLRCFISGFYFSGAPDHLIHQLIIRQLGISVLRSFQALISPVQLERNGRESLRTALTVQRQPQQLLDPKGALRTVVNIGSHIGIGRRIDSIELFPIINFRIIPRHSRLLQRIAVEPSLAVVFLQQPGVRLPRHVRYLSAAAHGHDIRPLVGEIEYIGTVLIDIGPVADRDLCHRISVGRLIYSSADIANVFYSAVVLRLRR